MSKVRRIASAVLLSAVLIAGTAMAGPGGGNRDGDPDGPQIAHPLVPTSKTASLDDVQGGLGPVSVAQERVSQPWKIVLRIYLRVHGISIG